MVVMLVLLPAVVLGGRASGASTGGRAVLFGSAPASNCAGTSVGFVPLSELGARTYHGYRGGLYPGGKNAPSGRYLAEGLAAAAEVRPVAGKIVLLSIGMSNATMEFSAFAQVADTDARRSASVTIVDGAEGGMDAVRIASADSPYWQFVEQRLQQAGASDAQVQVVWLKEAIAGESEGFPADALRLRGALREIVDDLAARFPNLRLVYLSSRIYAGYASSPLNPEPAAYDSGFAVKWLVGDRMAGRIAGPWLGWGPYLWADGMHPRKDGLSWSCSDLGPDGTHPSQSGVLKVEQALLAFFTSNATAKAWFTGR
jgi:hypothetical protein